MGIGGRKRTRSLPLPPVESTDMTRGRPGDHSLERTVSPLSATARPSRGRLTRAFVVRSYRGTRQEIKNAWPAVDSLWKRE